MQLLKVDKDNYIGQADPYIIEHNGKFYIYTTGEDGIYAYSSDSLFDGWNFEGRVFTVKGGDSFWAPSVIELDGAFYMYCSYEYYEDVPDKGGHHQALFISKSDSPLGPFGNEKQLLHPFSIDSHIVKTEAGLFLFYSTNSFDCERPGTYIALTKMSDPYTVEGEPVTVLTPSIDEEIFRRDRYKKGEHWHTLEGAFWFCDGEYQYLMYSGSCYENDTYFVGCASAKTNEQDLRKVNFQKMPDEHIFCPVLTKNEWEEGTGHNSVIKYKNEYYAVYHARNKEDDGLSGDRRNARICKLKVKDGNITAERFPDRV